MDRRLARAHKSRALPERLHLKQWKVWALVLTLKQRAVPGFEACKGQEPRCWPAWSECGVKPSVAVYSVTQNRKKGRISGDSSIITGE